MVPPLAAAPDDAADEARLARYRRVIIAALILVALGSLAFGAPSDHGIPAGERWFLLAGSVVFAAVVYAFGLRSSPTLRPAPWAAVIAILGLASSLFVVGGMNWLAVLAVSAGTCGRFSRTPRPAVAASAACAVAGYYVAVTGHAGYGATFAAIVIGPLTAFSATAPVGERTQSARYAGPGLTWPGRRWRRSGFASRATCMICSAIRCR